jgi:release factor glutamine methyltransferase
MTIREALAEGTALLASSHIDAPGLDASLLLAETLHTLREGLIARGPEPLAEEDLKNYRLLLRRRLEGECTAYILGRKEFYGLEFIVSPHVLVPRPDTEILVETVLLHMRLLQNFSFETATLDLKGKTGLLTGFSKSLSKTNRVLEQAHLNEKNTHARAVRVLDLCTGSGAVAVALKHERPDLEVSASDVSGEALTAARANSKKLLGRAEAVRFIESDLFEKIHGSFGLIVSNPPYVASAEIDALAPEVRREPRLALDGGKDGLDLIRRIAHRAGDYLEPGGALFLEADPRRMDAVREILAQAGFIGIRSFPDLSGRERVIRGINRRR